MTRRPSASGTLLPALACVTALGIATPARAQFGLGIQFGLADVTFGPRASGSHVGPVIEYREEPVLIVARALITEFEAEQADASRLALSTTAAYELVDGVSAVAGLRFLRIEPEPEAPGGSPEVELGAVTLGIRLAARFLGTLDLAVQGELVPVGASRSGEESERLGFGGGALDLDLGVDVLEPDGLHLGIGARYESIATAAGRAELVAVTPYVGYRF